MIKKATLKSFKSVWNTLPLMMSTLMLSSLVVALVPNSFYLKLLDQNPIVGLLLGTSVGSISAGNPITSYVLGGEFLSRGLPIIIVTAFLVSWVTVGIIQIPAEISVFGKKFSFYRNILAFIFSILTAVITTIIFKLIK